MRWRAAAASLALVLAASACTDVGAINRRAASRVEVVDPATLPAQIGGLAVAAEPVEGVDAAQDAFVDRIGLFGLRKGELLQATLQVSRFNDEAELPTPLGITNRIGGGAGRVVRMGGADVVFTTTAGQQLVVWFRDRWLHVLSIREDYPTPRTLVRAALEVRAS